MCERERERESEPYRWAERGVDLGGKGAVPKLRDGSGFRGAFGNANGIGKVEGIHKVKILLVSEVKTYTLIGRGERKRER